MTRFATLFSLECEALWTRRFARWGLALTFGTAAAAALGGLWPEPNVTFVVRNGFRCVGMGLGPGLLVAGLVGLLLGAQAVAAEAGEGSLRATLMRPVGRVPLLLAKASALAVAALVLALVAALGAWLAGLPAGYGDVVTLYEGLPVAGGGQSAGAMWRHLATCVALAPGPVLAAAALGLAVSSATEHPGTAAAVAVFLAVPVVLVPALRMPGHEWCFAQPVGAVLGAFTSLANAIATNAWATAPIARALWLPLATAAAAVGVAAALIRRRDILT